MKKSIFTLLLALCTLLGANAAKKNVPQDSIRVLFIGNSYTYYNNMPAMVDSIAKSQKKLLSITRVVKGGEKFAGHLKNPKLHELLKKGGWNFVVLQEQSAMPSYPTAEVARTTYKAAHTLDSLIVAGSPDAKVIFYMTWGHKYGCQKPWKDNYPMGNNYEGMQERLITSYLEMAYDNDARCAPVGMAWREIRRTHPELQLYKPDCSHPSALGSYLVANVIYTTMFPKPYQTGFTTGIDSSTAEIIQQIAQQTVLNNKETLNIK